MRKVYKRLTKDQKERDIVFSSKLISDDMNDKIHEVKIDDPERDEKIERLTNDKFFNSSPFKFNEIRT